jgi:hypothetical protein
MILTWLGRLLAVSSRFSTGEAARDRATVAAEFRRLDRARVQPPTTSR